MKATHSMTDATGWNDEQTAAKTLGYTQVTWDDASGQETEPSSVDKYWDELTTEEKSGAVDLGFTAKTWDNESGKEKQPASEYKTWAELNVCGKFVPSSQLLHTSDWSSNTQ